MEVYGDLIVFCTQSDSARLMSVVEASLPAGWVRDKEAEKRGRTGGELDGPYYFTCTADAGGSAALVAVYRRDAGTLYVSNVVPREVGQFSYEEYNRVLQRFYQDVLKPRAESLGIRCELRVEEKALTDFVSAEAAEKLRFFSHAANKSTGSSHPLDQQRWFDFLCSVHGSHNCLSTSDLRRWLVEEQGWDEEHAHELAIEYEFAMGLLDFYTQR